MRGLFWRLWAAMVVVVVLALAIDVLLWLSRAVAQDKRYVADIARGGVAHMVEAWRAAPANERPALLERLAAQANCPIVEVTTEQVPDDVRGATQLAAWHNDELQPFVYVPLGSDASWLRVGPMSHVDWGEGESLYIVFEIALTALVVAALFGLILHPTVRRLRDLERATRAMAQGDLTVRVASAPGAATAPLSDALNHMALRLDATLAAQRRLLHAVSHELRTPLTRIRLGLHLLEPHNSDGFTDQRAVLEQDLDEVEGLVGEMLDMARLDEGAPVQRVQLNVADALRQEIARRTVAPGTRVEMDEHGFTGTWPLEPVLFARAIGNLIDNARRYARTQVVVSAAAHADVLDVLVDDDGPGIPPADRKRVLEAFVRLDDGMRGGYGLGLAIVHGIATRHGGEVSIEEAPGGGCRVRTVWRKVTVPGWTP